MRKGSDAEIETTASIKPDYFKDDTEYIPVIIGVPEETKKACKELPVIQMTKEEELKSLGVVIKHSPRLKPGFKRARSRSIMGEQHLGLQDLSNMIGRENMLKEFEQIKKGNQELISKYPPTDYSHQADEMHGKGKRRKSGKLEDKNYLGVE